MSPSDKNLVKVLLYVIGFAILYCIVMPLYYDGGYNVLEKKNLLYLMAQNKKADSDISDFSNKIFSIQSINKDYQNISQSSKDKLDSVIVQKIDVLRSLYDLDKMVQKFNLKMLSLPTYSLGKVSKDAGFSAYTFNMTIKGDYFNFLRFLEAISNSLQVYTIKSLSLSKEDNSDEYNFQLILESYEMVNK
jgi:hypothetical protein